MRLLAAALAVSLAFTSTGCTPKVQEGVGIGFGGVGLLSTIGGAAWCKTSCHDAPNLAGSLGMIGGGVLFMAIGASLIATKNMGDPPPPPAPPPGDPPFSPPPM